MTEPPPDNELSELRALAEGGNFDMFRARAEHLHPSDVSDVLAELDEPTRLKVVAALPAELVSEALAEMEPEEHPEEVLAALEPGLAADIVEELDDDDAADLIGELSPERASTILAAVDDREEIERLLGYDEESAGGIMTTAIVAVHDVITAAAAIDVIRQLSDAVEDLHDVYCTDEDDVLVGVISLQALVQAPADRPVRDIMEPPPATAAVDLDQEQVARLMARYNVVSVPVLDNDGRLLGRVTFDDVIDVVEAEQTEDLLMFGGVSGDEQLGAKWHHAVRSRLPWLLVNLLTASLSAGVVFLFRGTIDAMVTLAMLLPVVAGMGGNAGTQALAVTVRRVSLHLIPRERSLIVVGKEMLVGLINGLFLGSVVGLGAWLLGETWLLGLVVLLAMWANLAVAGLAGASIPLLLERLGFDPAVASSVFVTAFTDVCGYLLLLGLAATLIL